MAKLVLYMSMSLDGFIAGPADDGENPLGVKGHRLHQWFPAGDGDPRSYRPANEPSRTVFEELLSTGAVVSGRRTAEHAGYWDGDHHDGVPVFVPTHSAPEPRKGIQFITDGIESCVAQAKAAAGDRNVLLHGAYTARECLRAGVLDELEIHLVPVLLGEGRRLFDAIGAEHVELDLVRALEAPDVLHLRYRVRQP